MHVLVVISYCRKREKSRPSGICNSLRLDSSNISTSPLRTYSFVHSSPRSTRHRRYSSSHEQRNIFVNHHKRFIDCFFCFRDQSPPEISRKCIYSFSSNSADRRRDGQTNGAEYVNLLGESIYSFCM